MAALLLSRQPPSSSPHFARRGSTALPRVRLPEIIRPRPVSVSLAVADGAYGGWDADFSASEDLDILDNLLSGCVSSGDARMYGAAFVLGFASAFTVSRVAVSALLLFPVSALAFVVGIVVGAGGRKGIHGFGQSEEKLGSLRSAMGELDDRMERLTFELVKIAGAENLGIEEVRVLAEAAKHARTGVASAASMIGEIEMEVSRCCKNELSTFREATLRSLGSCFVAYVSDLVKNSLGDLSVLEPRKKGGKEKLTEKTIGSIKEDGFAFCNVQEESATCAEPVVTNRSHEDVNSSKIENPSLSKVECNAVDNNHAKQQPFNNRHATVDGSSSRDRTSNLGMISYDYETGDSTSRKSSVVSQDSMIPKHPYKKNSADEFVDSSEDTDHKTWNIRRGSGESYLKDSKKSSLLERTVEIHNRSYSLKFETTGNCVFNKSDVTSEDRKAGISMSSGLDEAINTSASGGLSDDEEFHQNVSKGSELLKKARESIASRAHEEDADNLLSASARLLSAAASLRPLSLVAVGQLGNTYLLHGELKLKISRELRTLLSRDDTYLSRSERGLQIKSLDGRILSRENVVTVLVGVCEECEQLLVEAGRKYRKALTIDGSDVKALYNWGLALSFRAELIADIGPEAAIDADKVYMAAIDKFDAMLARSNAYAPEALYRWGVVLHQRSQLRPQRSKEKIRLLEQAKSMFEDALYVEADNQTVREALSSCIAELNHHGRWLR